MQYTAQNMEVCRVSQVSRLPSSGRGYRGRGECCPPLWDMHPPLDPSQVPIIEGSSLAGAGVHQLDWTMMATNAFPGPALQFTSIPSRR